MGGEIGDRKLVMMVVVFLLLVMDRNQSTFVCVLMGMCVCVWSAEVDKCLPQSLSTLFFEMRVS